MFAPKGANSPPGKAGRYESTLEGLRALQTSRKRFVNDLKAPGGKHPSGGLLRQPHGPAYFPTQKREKISSSSFSSTLSPVMRPSR